MRKIEKLFAAAALLICTAFVAQAQTGDPMANVERFGRTILYINNNYVDTVNFDAITDASIKEVVSKLDPHSIFIPKDEVQAMNEPLEGKFEGIGIEFAIINDTLTVQAVIVGGPSEAVGLNAGDKIVEVDGENIASVNISNDGVRKKLRGPKGTIVNLKVRRHGVAELLEYSIVRNTIPLTSIDASYCPEPNLLYVKLSRFAQSSASEFINALKSVDDYPRGIIIDLRGNGGGYLQIALMLANFFLEPGSLILYTEGMHSPVSKEYAGSMCVYPNGPLVVLVDENSASASEILAGALQDWDRGVIVGRRSFGKGLVQRQFDLSDGSQLRLTVARYHTPSGRVIQSPYEAGHRDEYYGRLYERYKTGEMFSKDSISFPDSLKFSTLKLHRTIYGGGGIMPDVFIPSDTAGFNTLLTRIVNRGLLTEFANAYSDEHRSQIVVPGRSFEDFYEFYNTKMEQEAFNELILFCEKKGVECEASQLSECEKLLKTRLKALIARTAFDTTGYYRIINMEEDPEFKAAMDIVKNWRGAFPAL